MKDFIALVCTLAVGLSVGSGLQREHDAKAARQAQNVALQIATQTQYTTDTEACTKRVQAANSVSQQSQLTSVKALADVDRYHKVVTQCLVDNGRLVELVNLCSGKAR